MGVNCSARPLWGKLFLDAAGYEGFRDWPLVCSADLPLTKHCACQALLSMWGKEGEFTDWRKIFAYGATA